MPKVADLVVSIPYTMPDGEVRARYQRVGALIQIENNDASKGPGYVIALDRHFNPAGIPPGEKGDGTSILLSTYWPEDKDGNKIMPGKKGGLAPRRKNFPLREERGFPPDEDDPFGPKGY